MPEKHRILAHSVESGGARVRMELRIDDAELSLNVTASMEIAFCVRIMRRQHCFEVRKDLPTTVLRILHGTPCTAYMHKAGRSVEIPIDDVLSVLRQAEFPLLWAEAEEAISDFTLRCREAIT